MAHKIYSEWKCDQCGEEVKMDAVGQPTGWGRLLLITPVKKSPDNDSRLDKQLCDHCVRELVTQYEPVNFDG